MPYGGISELLDNGTRVGVVLTTASTSDDRMISFSESRLEEMAEVEDDPWYGKRSIRPMEMVTRTCRNRGSGTFRLSDIQVQSLMQTSLIVQIYSSNRRSVGWM